MILAASVGQEPARPPVYACNPALAALFTPRQPLMGRYEVCTTSEPLEDDQVEALEKVFVLVRKGSSASAGTR